MSNTDPGGLGPGLKARLRAELDRIRPPATPPRYLASGWSLRAWRLTPVALALAFTGILALTAVAATGSPNPVVWSQRVQTVINPPPSPTNEESPSAPQSHTEGQAPAQQESPEPAEAHEAGSPVQPTESPEPAQEHSGEGSSEPSPSPTPADR